MDGFFGIGFLELILIAIVALIVLGPERLPGVMREIAGFIRHIRRLSAEFTAQFRQEFRDFEDLDPRKILDEVIDPKPSPAKPRSIPPPKNKPIAPIAPAVTPVPPRAAGNSAKPAGAVAEAGLHAAPPAALPDAPRAALPAALEADASTAAESEIEPTILPPAQARESSAASPSADGQPQGPAESQASA